MRTRLALVSALWVFAYGSNMDAEDYRQWCTRRGRPYRDWLQAEPARLPHHRLTFDYDSRGRGGGAANVVAERGASVFGLALRVDSATFDNLDSKEDCPRVYQRTLLWIESPSAGSLEAWVYQVRPQLCAAQHIPPTPYYLGLIRTAAQRYGFPRWYCDMLERISTV